MAGDWFTKWGPGVAAAAGRMSEIIQSNRVADAEREKFKYEADYNQEKSQQNVVFGNDEAFKLDEKKYGAVEARKAAKISSLTQQLIDDYGTNPLIAAKQAQHAQGDIAVVYKSDGLYGLADDGKGGHMVVNQIPYSKKQFSKEILSGFDRAAESDPDIMQSPGVKNFPALMASEKSAAAFKAKWIGVGKGKNYHYEDRKAYNTRRNSQITANAKVAAAGNKSMNAAEQKVVRQRHYESVKSIYEDNFSISQDLDGSLIVRPRNSTAKSEAMARQIVKSFHAMTLQEIRGGGGGQAAAQVPAQAANAAPRPLSADDKVLLKQTNQLIYNDVKANPNDYYNLTPERFAVVSKSVEANIRKFAEAAKTDPDAKNAYMFNLKLLQDMRETRVQ